MAIRRRPGRSRPDHRIYSKFSREVRSVVLIYSRSYKERISMKENCEIYASTQKHFKRPCWVRWCGRRHNALPERVKRIGARQWVRKQRWKREMLNALNSKPKN